jgi:hypothetical protein
MAPSPEGCNSSDVLVLWTERVGPRAWTVSPMCRRSSAQFTFVNVRVDAASAAAVISTRAAPLRVADEVCSGAAAGKGVAHALSARRDVRRRRHLVQFHVRGWNGWSLVLLVLLLFLGLRWPPPPRPAPPRSTGAGGVGIHRSCFTSLRATACSSGGSCDARASGGGGSGW